MRRRFLKVFAFLTYIKICPLKAWPLLTPGTSFEKNLNLLVLGMLHAKYCLVWWSSSWEDFL